MIKGSSDRSRERARQTAIVRLEEEKIGSAREVFASARVKHRGQNLRRDKAAQFPPKESRPAQRSAAVLM